MSSSSCSSGSPSSSAVTIPIPGKSILKKAAPAQQSLFSRFTRFLPTQNAAGGGQNEEPLKRAHFILPHIATVYPISSFNPPSMVGLKEEKRAIEAREMERRRRVVRGDSMLTSSIEGEAAVPDEWWGMDKVDSFYKECCAGCDEQPDPNVSGAFKHAATITPRTVDLSGVQLTLTSAAILSDVFTIEWGLRKLVFKECDLDEHNLKPMLHSLLIPNSLTFLSVASNRRLKTPAFKLIAAYVERSESLQFLDLSQNPLDKKSIEYIMAALKTPPETGLTSLRLDDCSLRPGALESLSRAVRTSSLRNISLRYNRINATGAVALALMIRDYPDVVPASPSTNSNFSLNSANSSQTSSPASSVVSLPLSPPSTPLPHAGPVLPPPRHPPTGLQTTYTPYVPRSKRGAASAPQINPLSASGQPVPILTSSSQGGITARQNPLTASHPHSGPSAALLDKVRALDALPRVGALRTLDLKGNDLRSGITFLAQVLKRNRTLKVLNLSENKLDSAGLVAIAEALKYNSSLETLDLSRNPCAVGLEGIQSLRTAFTLNTALKRLFLSSTLLTSAGAIALAEFLPESTSLLHLDLTQNQLDLASVIALESGMKANTVLRCLDLDVPPGDEQFARCCRGILGSCVRNTEDAQKRAEEIDGVDKDSLAGKKVWGILEDSELAKRIRMEESVDGDVVVRARLAIAQMKSILSATPLPETATPQQVSTHVHALIDELGVVIQATDDPERMEELFGMHDQLTELVGKVDGLRQRPILSLQGLGVRLNGLPSPRMSPRPSPILHGSTIEVVEPSTPRIDKGKAKAEPVFEQVLSPTSVLMEDTFKYDDSEELKFPSALPDDGEEDNVEDEEENVVEYRSRSWVEEEGEVFRKAPVLLGPEEMEGEYAGEDLRKELLEAMVERPPPRALNTDEFGTELNPLVINGNGNASPHSSPHPDVEEKILPRPYISRSRSSSSSIMSLVTTPTQSPTLASPVVMSPNTNTNTLGPSLSRIPQSP